MDERQQAFLGWLERLRAESHRLLSILEQERQVLRERDSQALLQVTKAKAAAVSKIDALLSQLPPSQDSKEVTVERLLQTLRLHGVGKAEALWREVRSLAQHCRELNEANGAMIALLQEQVRQALTVLFGHRRQQVCYTADGRSQIQPGERLLGKG